MSNFFISIYNWVEKHKVASILLFVLVIIISTFYASRLKLSEDITKILPENDKINHMNFVYSNSKFMDKVVFNISFRDSSVIDPALLAKFTNKLTNSISTKYIPGLVQSLDLAPEQKVMMDVYNAVYSNLPIFLSEADFSTIDTLISSENIQNAISANYSSLISPASFVTSKFISKDPLHFTPFVLEKFRTLNIDNDFNIYNNYFISKDKKNLIFLLTPTSTNNSDVNDELFKGIDKIINQLTKNTYSDIRVDYFGNAVVALGNANQIKNDIILTVSIALFLLVIAITIFFRSKRTFLIVFLPVGFGALVSLALLAIFKKEVSAISLGIGAVLLGICVDYALHIYSHFRQHGSHRLILKNLSTPIILSSLTTASAFLSLYFVNSDALNDLGLLQL